MRYYYYQWPSSVGVLEPLLIGKARGTISTIANGTIIDDNHLHTILSQPISSHSSHFTKDYMPCQICFGQNNGWTAVSSHDL